MNDTIKYLPLIVCLVGLVIWRVVLRLQDSQPLAEVGKIMFATGLLALLINNR